MSQDFDIENGWERPCEIAEDEIEMPRAILEPTPYDGIKNPDQVTRLQKSAFEKAVEIDSLSPEQRNTRDIVVAQEAQMKALAAATDANEALARQSSS